MQIPNLPLAAITYGFYRIAKVAEKAVLWRNHDAIDEAQEMAASDAGISVFLSEAVERKKRIRSLAVGWSLLLLVMTVALIGGLSLVV
jgi:hypothetical protein